MREKESSKWKESEGIWHERVRHGGEYSNEQWGPKSKRVEVRIQREMRSLDEKVDRRDGKIWKPRLAWDARLE